MITRWLYSLFFLLLCISVFSQPKDSVKSNTKAENYFRFGYDNDFFNATDRYYTQGVYVNFTHSILRYSPFSKTLFKLNKSALNYYTLILEQDCFTPRSIRHPEVYFGERPYAATYYLAHRLTSNDPEKKAQLETQLDLGQLGPCARCEEEQKAIHKALVNIQPLGWEHQITGDYVLNYRAKFEKGIFNTEKFECMVAGFARLGTLYTDAGAGIHLRFGRFSPYFNNLGLEKNSINRKLKIYGTFKANTRIIGYNATLQGGLINTTSIYVVPNNKISRIVFDGLASAVVAYNRFSIEFSKTYITPEFKGGVDHGWGKCLITVCF